MTPLFILNELTLPRFLWCAWRRQAPVVLAVTCLLPRLRPFMTRVVDRLCRTGRARWFTELVPELRHAKEAEHFGARSNVFAETESWLNVHFGFAALDQRDPRYALPIKFVCCKISQGSYNTILILRAILDRLGRDHCQIIGLDDHDAGLYAAYFHETPPTGPAFQARFAVNLGLTLLFVAAATMETLRSLRLRPAPPRTIPLGSDFIADSRDVAVWREIVDSDDDVLIVLRNRSQIAQVERVAPGFCAVLPDSGHFSPAQALAALGMVWRHSLRLFLDQHGLPTRFFYPIIALPFRRVRFRALFSRYHFQRFWGRDDYNVEHMIRSQELRRTGGVSLGINHGLPVVFPVAGEWRYLDFDRYYVFGRHLHARYLHDTWPKSMAVTPIGSFAMTRERLARLGEPKPPDVVFFLSPDPGRLAAMREVFRLAELVSDRTVFVKMKPGKEALMADVTALCQDHAPPNLRLTTENSYDLLYRCRYVFAITTTMVAEAVQFGCVTFALDVYGDAIPHFYYRDFPDLCVTSAEQAAQRIRAVEDGSWVYPRDRFGELIDLSGRSCYELIREDLGLAPRAPAIPVPDSV